MADRLRARALPWGLAVAGVVLGLLVARAPVMLVVGGPAALALVAGSLAEPLIGIGAALVVGPFRAWLEIRSPGIAPQVGQAVLLVAVGAWAVRKLLETRSLGFPKPQRPSAFMRLGPLVAFLGVSLLSLWAPVDAWTGFLEWVKWAQVLLVAVVVLDRLQATGGSGVAWALTGLGTSAGVQAAVGLWQFGLRGTGVENFAIDERFFRAYGTFQQPNPYAGLLGLIGALAVGAAAATFFERLGEAGPDSAAWWLRLKQALLGSVWAVAPALLIVAGLGASWSRGGWMGFGAAGLVMLVFLPRRSRWGLLALGAAVVVVGALAVTGRLPASIVERLTGFLSYVRFEDVRGVDATDATYAVLERMAHWQAALEMWRARFWLGVGLGGYEPAYPTYRLIAWPLALGHAHNAYLNLLAEVGLVGLAAYVVWLGSLISGAMAAVRRGTGWSRALALGLLGAWTHLAVHSLVDYLLVNNVHLHVGVMVALSAYVVTLSREGAQRSQRASS